MGVSLEKRNKILPGTIDLGEFAQDLVHEDTLGSATVLLGLLKK